jgi:predicted nucleic acid-binding Zn ribbon protein
LPVSFDIAMPTYVYKFIDTGETIEIQQSFDDATLTEAVHPESGATMPVKKVFLPVGVTFKGDGFYKTDSRASRSSSSSSTSSSTPDPGSGTGSSGSSESSAGSGTSSASSAGGSSAGSSSAAAAGSGAGGSSD